MEELHAWRSRHHNFKIELLKLSKKIEETENTSDILFYQEICEKYAYHLKKIESACYDKVGVTICGCNFNPEHCTD
ncbi:hypothetical protein ASL14_13195 [Paenibacillus sp. IHB B 3084]|uniref:hypothetical protein n=1 Tax=Paenibacillus TaxID=44249 RepID=UPI0004704711|nr:MULTISPECIES: hypothetical protein [Paenibacillus]ALP36979.1 hypothetical protein ASL14_13195 [Paenibacillus sp. IHB B 3084]MDY8045037.1 hypothetical protein [Paenibacillus polymyxa]